VLVSSTFSRQRLGDHAVTSAQKRHAFGLHQALDVIGPFHEKRALQFERIAVAVSSCDAAAARMVQRRNAMTFPSGGLSIFSMSVANLFKASGGPPSSPTVGALLSTLII
jgi:hypothetical protein